MRNEGEVTESDERRLAEIRWQDGAYIQKHGNTFYRSDFSAAAGRHDLLRMLDSARAENARILAILRDPPEDVVHEVSDALFSVHDFPSAKNYYSRLARAALSALAGKIAEGQQDTSDAQTELRRDLAESIEWDAKCR